MTPTKVIKEQLLLLQVILKALLALCGHRPDAVHGWAVAAPLLATEWCPELQELLQHTAAALCVLAERVPRTLGAATSLVARIFCSPRCGVLLAPSSVNGFIRRHCGHFRSQGIAPCITYSVPPRGHFPTVETWSEDKEVVALLRALLRATEHSLQLFASAEALAAAVAADAWPRAQFACTAAMHAVRGTGVWRLMLEFLHGIRPALLRRGQASALRKTLANVDAVLAPSLPEREPSEDGAAEEPAMVE